MATLMKGSQNNARGLTSISAGGQEARAIRVNTY